MLHEDDAPLGLICTTPEEFAGWYAYALAATTVHRPTDAAHARRMFCADGDPPWCSAMRAHDRCTVTVVVPPDAPLPDVAVPVQGGGRSRVWKGGHRI